MQNASQCSHTSIPLRSWEVGMLYVRQSRQLTLGHMTLNHRAQVCVCLYLFYTHSLGNHIRFRAEAVFCVDSTRNRRVSCVLGLVSCISPWSNQMDLEAEKPRVLLFSVAAHKLDAMPSQHESYRTTLKGFKIPTKLGIRRSLAYNPRTWKGRSRRVRS